MKKSHKIIYGVVIAVSLLVFVDVSYHYWLLATGRAFKYERRYWTKQEFDAVYGGSMGFNTPAKNTPEEVYTKFREAILANKTEEALQYIVVEKREEYRKYFSDIKIYPSYKELPLVETLKKDNSGVGGNYIEFRYYKIENKVKTPYSVDFEKNKDGYWFISLI